MKININKPAVTLAVFLCMSTTANVLLIMSDIARHQKLTMCAQENNVFACSWEAVPTVAPKLAYVDRVQYVQPELLPPPDKNSAL